MQHFPKFPATRMLFKRWFCFSSWFKSQSSQTTGKKGRNFPSVNSSRNKSQQKQKLRLGFACSGSRWRVAGGWWSVFLRYHAGNWRIYGEWNFRCLCLWKLQQTEESRDLPKVSLQQCVYPSAFSTLNSCQGGKKTYLLTSGICTAIPCPTVGDWKQTKKWLFHAT